MQYQESYTEFDLGLIEAIKKVIPTSFASALKANGTELEFPQDRGIELKLKYDAGEEGRKLTLKLSWDNETGENDEEVDDED
ncbi:MAG: hypothetical protein GX625_03075 [Clostridiaceae bacterium]|nr:hypothetical protein [Clostridiaceae bacterium]